MHSFTELAFLKHLVYSKNSINTENIILGKTDKDSCPMKLSCTVGIQVVNTASKLIINVTEDYWCYGKNKRQKDGVREYCRRLKYETVCREGKTFLRRHNEHK